MITHPPRHKNLLTSVSTILIQAGNEIILPAFQHATQTSTKADGSTVTETDLASQHFIRNALAALDHKIDFLGEEMGEIEQLRCLTNREGSYWCLDPLDGTSNFVAGFPGFAISLALIEQGEVTLACIHDPYHAETFSAISDVGAWLNDVPINAAAIDSVSKAVGFIDFKRLSKRDAIRMATKPAYRSQRNLGSCALEWAWLAAGRGHFIIHGGEKLWDFAAGSLLARESGAVVGDFSGDSLFPCDTLSSPILAACNRSVHASLKGQLDETN